MNERNYGVDLLRILAGFMIVFLHCFTMGGILLGTQEGSSQEVTALLCSVLVIAGVNIFAVISGYVSCCSKDGKTKYSKYIEIWVTAVFYGLGVLAVMCLMFHKYAFMGNLKTVLMPVSSNMYWYFTAFTGLYLLKPFIDTGLRKSSPESLKKLFFVILFGFSFWAVLADVCKLNKDIFQLYRGYSPFWIIILYIIGYSVNKCRIMEKYKTGVLLLVLLLVYIIAFFASYIIKHHFVNESLGVVDSCLVYTYPTTVITAVLFLVIFSRIRVPDKMKKYIKFIAPTVFSIYLLNCHPLLKDEIMVERFLYLREESPLVIVWSTLGFSIAFTIAAVIIDLLRIQIFKLLHIKNLAVFIENTVHKGINKLADLI